MSGPWPIPHLIALAIGCLRDQRLVLAIAYIADGYERRWVFCKVYTSQKLLVAIRQPVCSLVIWSSWELINPFVHHANLVWGVSNS